MKIALAGSHGTGKSTFAKDLAKRLNLNIIPDIVRVEAVPKGFKINENTSPEVQLWLMMRQWELEKTTPESWVADKCLIDYLIYGLTQKDDNVKAVLRKITEDNAKYDFVFYLPIEFPMESDGVRSDDENFRKIVDVNYKKYLDEHGIKYFILSGSPEERIRKALEIIS